MMKTHFAEGKITTLHDLDTLKAKFQEKKVVLVGGCFDLFHFGHLVFFEGAKKSGDVLVVALESDEFITLKKKRSPIHTQAQRAFILANLTLVDAVITLPFLKTYSEYFQLVSRLRPDVIAITEGDPYQSEKEKQAAEINAVVKVVAPRVDTHSTSAIIQYETIFSN